MNDDYYAPANLQQEWDALLYCDVCEKDTEQAFTQWRRVIVYANCSECETETEIDPDGFDG